MGGEFWSMFQLETKRLLWLIGITFAVIIAFQYLELPYGKISTSRSTTSQPTDTNNTIVNNVTFFNQPNSTSEHALEIETPSEEKVTIPKTSFILKPVKASNKSLGFDESDKSSIVESIKRLDAYSPSPSPENAPIDLTPPFRPTTNVRPNITTAVLLSQKDNKTSSIKKETFRQPQNGKNSVVSTVPKVKEDPHTPISDVTTVSEMNKLLLRSHDSYRSMKPRWFSAVDQELLQARSEIENAPIVKNDRNLYGPIYHNVSMFKRSYELMEQTLKVYVYKEGARPILHSPFLTGIYASEGWFMKLMEDNKRFVTKDPKKAHLFYLPFSSWKLEEALYVKDSHSRDNLVQYLHGYVDLIAGRHPFWNRTGGADHFLVGCHDWAPAETKVLMANCIRSLCNADVKDGFVFGKDASLPETYVRNARNPTRDLGGNCGSKKTTLAFFAGSMHGYVRPILLQHWENKILT